MPTIDSEKRLGPQTLQIQKDADRTLLLAQNGHQIEVDEIICCFPETSPQIWISLRTERGNELGLLPSLDGLKPDVREHIETILKERYPIPTIFQIRKIESISGGSHWQVETEEGPKQFQIRSDRGVDLNAFPQMFFTDSTTRKRFRIPDYNTLDRTSKALLRGRLNIGRREGGGRHRGRGGRSR